MTEEKQEMSSSMESMPILQRLDRLERSLHFLEDNHWLSSKSSSEEAALDHKTLSSAVDEVRCKGTLMERVAMLESRVLQPSIEMDVEKASSSSCSTILVSDQKFQYDKQGSLINGEYISPKECKKATGVGESWQKKNKEKQYPHHSVERMV